MALTRRPVGLLMWRGAHAWEMSGFGATANPATNERFTVTSLRVVDPWYPRTSSIWGAGQRPDSAIPVARLAADFLPWRRPAVRYVEKDGQYVLVLPVAPVPRATPVALPAADSVAAANHIGLPGLERPVPSATVATSGIPNGR
jgi:hypothetical protein